ncbi:MAG: PspC domain-containing protein, partial [Pseudomonadota bacterium]
MNSPRTKLYRDKHNGKLMGVCAGIADYTGIDAFWIRMGLILLTIALGWPLLAYFVAGFILNKKPPHLYRDESEQKYWQRVRQSPQRTAREIRAN